MTETGRLEGCILAASGAKKPELVLKNARIVNVFTETVEEGDIAIENGMIVGIGAYEGNEERDLKGMYVCPGFIDGHIHMESSMVSPKEFERAVLPHGTTAVITDPHEIANVAGESGIQYMMKATKDLNLDVFFMLPSCVPSTDLDEAGAVLKNEHLKSFYENDRVLGLAEMMNGFGVIHSDRDCLEKLKEAGSRHKKIDGHAPMMTGKELNAYITAGIRSDHECSDMAEAREKLARGQWIMVRQGTAAKNLNALIGVFEAPFYQRAMLVTDDKHPGDLISAGHIDAIIRQAVRLGADPIHAVKMGSFNTAQYFGLENKGAVAPGYDADLVVLDSLQSFQAVQVYKAGKLAADHGILKVETEDAVVWPDEIMQRVFHSFHMKPVTCADLKLEVKGKKQRVIDLTAGELITRERIVEWKENPGYAPGVDTERDIVKMAVFERHKNTGHVGLGFLGKYGLKKGAVATSIGHDSHNLVVVGVREEDMVLAANQVLKNQGGLAIALDGSIAAELPLPIAGLMTDLPAEMVEEKLAEMKGLLRKLGISEEIDPFMTLAFVSLPVIPDIRLNTYGIIDVPNHQIVEAVF